MSGGRMLPIALYAEKVVQGYGFDYNLASDLTSLEFRAVTTCGTFDAEFIISEEARLIRYFVLVNPGCSLPPFGPVLVELATRVNRELAIGSLVCVWEDGSAWYRASLDLTDHPDPARALERCMDHSAFAIQLYDAASRFLPKARSNVRASVEAALIMLNDGSGHPTPEALRLLRPNLKVLE